MARLTKRLTVKAVMSQAERGMYADGDGLYLQISKWGTKSWIYRYKRSGRNLDMGLGSYPSVSLAKARKRADEQRDLRAKGIDPIEQRRDAKRQTAQKFNKTFEHCAKAYIESHEAGWRNTKHRQQWRNTLASYVYPVFGTIPVADVDTKHVMSALQPIWTKKPETANRVRQRIEAVLDWATAIKYRQGENPARWKGHLKNLLPNKSKVRRVKHHAALPFGEIGDFMNALRKQQGVTPRALEFTILTAARTGEVLGATWGEVDLVEKVWSAPPERMKSDREKPHRVPLADDAVRLLREMEEFKRSEFVFPGQQARGLSNMALLMLLRRMGRNDITVHGFRSTFRNWAAEQTGFPREVCEMALAHAIGDETEAAYWHSDLFKKRLQLMDAWAGYCSQPIASSTDNVVSLGA